MYNLSSEVLCTIYLINVTQLANTFILEHSLFKNIRPSRLHDIGRNILCNVRSREYCTNYLDLIYYTAALAIIAERGITTLLITSVRPGMTGQK